MLPEGAGGESGTAPGGGRPRPAVGGADAAYDAGRGRVFAVVALVDRSGRTRYGRHVGPIPAPYRPGAFARREGPPILAALAALPQRPGLLFVDGHGRAHPRRRGLACALAAATGLPVVGVAKSLLVGRAAVPPPWRGGWAPIVEGGEVVGAALRTRDGVRPVYVSVGGGLTLPQAIEAVLAWSGRHRIPEPLRLAHAEAGRLRAAVRSGALR